MTRSQGLSFLELSSLGSDEWLGVGAWNTRCWSEMFLGLSVFVGSKKEGVGTYIMIDKINTLIIIKKKEKSLKIRREKCVYIPVGVVMTN